MHRKNKAKPFHPVQNPVQFFLLVGVLLVMCRIGTCTQGKENTQSVASSGLLEESHSSDPNISDPSSAVEIIPDEKEQEDAQTVRPDMETEQQTTSKIEKTLLAGSLDVNPSMAALSSIGLEVDPQLICASLMLSEIPDYENLQAIVINDDQPSFSWNQDTLPLFEYYGELDEQGRCTVAMASVGPETLPDSEREDISAIYPTGYVQKEYDFVDNGYLYNRSHLIAHCLSAENANASNLVTGTRSMNLAMIPLETEVANYVKNTGNHVLYRATPVFEGSNLLCSGVLLEAQSMEDQGEAISFCRYIYNVEPGVEIDYSSGESWIASEDTPTFTYPAQPQDETAADLPDRSASLDSDEAVYNYVANTSTKKFHHPNCSSVAKMAEHNKAFYSSRDQLILEGFVPCKICKP